MIARHGTEAGVDGLKRINQGMFAKILEMIARVSERIIFVPVFAYLMTDVAFQDWAVLISINTFLAVFDFGMRQVFGNHLRDMWVKGELQAQQSYFKAVVLLYGSIAVVLTLVSVLASYVFGIHRLFHFEVVPLADQPNLMFLTLMFGVVTFVRAGILEIYRANDQYPRFINFNTILWWPRFAITILAIVLWRDILIGWSVFFACLVVLGIGLPLWDIRKTQPHLWQGFGKAKASLHASPRECFYLWVGDMARLFALQGPTLLINAMVKDGAVVLAFLLNRNLVTTLREFGMQFALNYGIELGRTTAAGDIRQQNAIILSSGIVLGFGLGAALGALTVVGDEFLNLLSKGGNIFDIRLFLMMAVSGVAVGITHVYVSWLTYAHKNASIFALRGIHGLVTLVGCIALIIPFQGYGAGLVLGLADMFILAIGGVWVARRAFVFPVWPALGVTIAAVLCGALIAGSAAGAGQALVAQFGLHGRTHDLAALAAPALLLGVVGLPIFLKRKRILKALRTRIRAILDAAEPAGDPR